MTKYLCNDPQCARQFAPNGVCLFPHTCPKNKCIKTSDKSVLYSMFKIAQEEIRHDEHDDMDDMKVLDKGPTRKYNRRSVIETRADGSTIRYDSITEAAKAYNTRVASVCNWIKSKYPRSNGSTFRYEYERGVSTLDKQRAG